MDHQFISIIVTFPEEDLARNMGMNLLKSSLVACAQIDGPTESMYSWKGDLQKDVEWKLVLKTQVDHYSEIEQIILAQHPYDTPQIIALPILQGYQPYLDWISECTAK